MASNITLLQMIIKKWMKGGYLYMNPGPEAEAGKQTLK
jgi:hypothetical protein